MEMKSNEAQEQVIQNTEGQMIVIACPGSGKTTTLLKRIRHIAKKDSSGILMVTFTASAAGEMRQRFISSYGKMENVTFSTIHAFCFAVLKKFAGYTNDSLLEESQARSYFFDRLSGEREIADKGAFISNLLLDISTLKNNRIPEKEFEVTCCQDKEFFLRLYEGYEAYKSGCGKIDYDDMLLEAYRVMQGDALKWLQEKYRYIQVDEYQDTNYLQRDILYRLAGQNGNLAVVGDDDQSIYAFRGARPDVMLAFPKDYPGCKVIRMGINYRSRPEIVQLAGKLISSNRKRYAKDISAARTEHGKIRAYRVGGRSRQYVFLSRKCQELLRNGERDVAVLTRTNRETELVASGFLRNKIPFHSLEPIQSRYDHWMYQDIKAYRSVAEGKGEAYSLHRAASHPQRWLGGVLQMDLRGTIDRINGSREEDWKKKKMKEEAMHFFSIVEIFKESSPADALDALFKKGGYRSYLQEYAEYRKEDPEELIMLWQQYRKDLLRADNSWSGWQQYIRLYQEGLKKAQEQKDGITIGTMHKSKGLEWSHVIIPSCVEGNLPYRRAIDISGIEEERRLFYVAVTRAKDSLDLVYFTSSQKPINRSRFLDEMTGNDPRVNDE